MNFVRFGLRGVMLLNLAVFGCDDSSDGSRRKSSNVESEQTPWGANIALTTSVTSSSITLSWEKATSTVGQEDGITYDIAYSLSIDDVTQLPWGDGATSATNGYISFANDSDIANTFTISGLLPDTCYYINVAARDSEGSELLYTTAIEGVTTAGPGTSHSNGLVTARPEGFLIDWTYRVPEGRERPYLVVRSEGTPITWWPTSVAAASEAWESEFEAGMELNRDDHELIYVGTETTYFDPYEDLEDNQIYYYKVITIENSVRDTDETEWFYFLTSLGLGVLGGPSPCCEEPKVDVYATTTATTISVLWEKSTDPTTAQSELGYEVAYSESIEDVIVYPWGDGATVATGGFLTDFVQKGTQNKFVIDNLSPDTIYYVNIVVKNNNDDTTLYTPPVAGFTTKEAD